MAAPRHKRSPAPARAGETEAVALGGLVRQCWGLADDGDATLVVETDRVVEADRSRLRRLLENLLRSAVNGGPGVTVTVCDTGDGDDGGFYVADDGSGIPASPRERAFERGVSSAEDGTGLGLKIVRGGGGGPRPVGRRDRERDGGARFEVTL